MKSIWFVLTLALFVSCTVNKQKSLEIDTTVIGDSLDNGHALMVKSNKYIITSIYSLGIAVYERSYMNQ